MSKVFALFVTLLASGAPAAEVSSNGTGGGTWSEPSTWRGNAVPRSEDEVTIRKGDLVLFDRNNDGKTTCHKLFIDPQGALKFKTETGKLVLVVDGIVESFGLIKLDGSKAASDQHELQLTGKTPEDRALKLQKGGALVASGKASLAGDKRNVRLLSRAPDKKATDLTGKLEASAGTTIDLRHCELVEFKVQGTEIDNTGARPNERVNVVGNRFLGRCGIYLLSCDTPVLTDNLFEYKGGPWQLAPAMTLHSCPLAEVKNNSVRGFFYYAIHLYGSSDSVVSGNTTEKAHVGFYCVGTAMFKANTVRQAGVGFIVTSMSGIVEDCIFEKCNAAVHLAGATMQMTNCIYRDPPMPNNKAIEFSAGEMLLVNCNFGPTMVNLPKVLNKTDKPLITSMYNLILGVKGDVEEDTLVDVRTANAAPLAPGAADLNVRNAPATLVNGRTPLPQSLSPILVKGWIIDQNGKTVPAPEYTVRILGPTDGVKERKVFKTLTVKPQDSWYRAKPNEPTPTVEVSLR